jgi:periplasmic protein CpxP/Spy
MKMTRQVLLAAAVLGVGASVVAALPRGQGPGPRGDRVTRMKQELGLTDEQVSKLADIREARQRDAIRHRADMEVARLDLQRLLHSAAVDRKAVDAKVKEISDLQSAGLRARVDTMLAMHEVLTPEQRQKWQALRSDFGIGEGRGRHGARRGSGRGFGSHRGRGPAPESDER